MSETVDIQPPPSPRVGFLATTRARVVAALAGAAAVALALVLALVVFAGGGVPSTIHGTVTSTVLSIGGGLSGQTPSDCILNLPSSGSQLLLKADGVTVAAAQLDKSGFHTYKSGLGEVCWEGFTFTGVPGGHQLYEVTITVSSPGTFASGGCSGTLYFKPSQLESGKTLNLSCQ
jgi:hypothetical protein